jgi:hypothetical protein
MSSIFFWRDWSAPYKRFWFLLLGLFVISFSLAWYYYFTQPASVISWEKIQEQKVIETTVHSFNVGPFKLSVPAESYVIFEYHQGSDLHHNTLASYIFLGILIFLALVLLTTITAMEGFWYFAAMSLFILFGVSLRLDVLQIFGLTGVIVPTVVLLVFTLLSYYFKSLRPETDFFTRLFIFIALAIVVYVFILNFSRIEYPILHLAVTAYTSALILTVIFLIMIAHELMAAFFYIASQSGSNRLRHFLIISTIYLVNIIITALHAVGYLEWNFFYINFLLLISISAILGLWGFRQRENLYENIFSFTPFGAIFYISLATIAFITLLQLLGNGNDAPVKVIQDLSIFTHTAFGIVFLIYVFSNFMVMMGDNIDVSKFLYRPNRMPYFTMTLAGIIVSLAFVFVTYWRDYVYQSFAGFYNYAADLYMLQDNEQFATTFYDRSRKSAYGSHRANYELGMLKASRLDFEAAQNHFDLANIRRPSDYSLINKGNLHLWHRDYFSAIKIFKAAETKKAFPQLFNNLGFAYAKVHNLDSAIYYLSVARESAETKASSEGNFIALAAAELLPIKTDSVVNVFDSKSNLVLANAMASATLFRQNLDLNIEPLKEKTLDLYSATLLNNYIIRNATTLDTAFTSEAWRIASDSVNFPFSEALKASLAYGYYHQGNIYKALEVLAELAFISQSYQGKYNYIMGLWALEQENPLIAHEYFIHSAGADYKDARFYNAIALTEARRLGQAMVAWDSVATYGDNAQKEIARRIQQILVLKPADALVLSDPEKYQYSRYVVSINDTTLFSRITNSFDNPNYKAQSLLDMAKRQFKANRIIPAIKYLNQTSGLELTNKKLYEEIKHFELVMLASRGEVQNLAKQINKDIDFGRDKALHKILYTALVNQVSGDTLNAEKNYRYLGRMNPYFEDAIIAAANYYIASDPESSKAYDILVEAIQVNKNSPRLLRAYISEATRQGFEGYAASAMQTLQQVEQEIQ